MIEVKLSRPLKRKLVRTAEFWTVGVLNNQQVPIVDARNLTDQSARVHTSFLKEVVELPGRGTAMGIRVAF